MGNTKFDRIIGIEKVKDAWERAKMAGDKIKYENIIVKDNTINKEVHKSDGKSSKANYKNVMAYFANVDENFLVTCKDVGKEPNEEKKYHEEVEIGSKKYYVYTNVDPRSTMLKHLNNALQIINSQSTEPKFELIFECSHSKDKTAANVKSSKYSEVQKDVINQILNEQYQIILCGAPGNGKTYTAKQVALGFIDGTAFGINNDRNDNVINRLYNLYNKYNELGAKSDTDEDENNIDRLNSLIDRLLGDYNYYDIKENEDKTINYRDTIINCLVRNSDDDLNSDESEEYDELAKKIANDITKGNSEGSSGEEEYTVEDFWKDANALKGRYAMVQFHPSYDYTDFVEGLRPIPDGKTHKFVKLDGNFKKFCRYVAWRNEISKQDEKLMYFYIIDEINRADLSKVFGELMLGLEKDKRGNGNPISTQYQNIETHFQPGIDDKYTDRFERGFYIPENIVIIGTMNDIDRSVESMDFALRRRFVWKRVPVTKESLEKAFTDGQFFSGNFFNDTEIGENLDSCKEFLDNYDLGKEININKKIAENVDAFNEKTLKEKFKLFEDYYIAQGQFTGMRLQALIKMRGEEFEKKIKPYVIIRKEAEEKYDKENSEEYKKYKECKEEAKESERLKTGKQSNRGRKKKEVSEREKYINCYEENRKKYIDSELVKSNIQDNTDEIVEEISDAIMEWSWKYRVEPLVREYLRGRRNNEAEDIQTAEKDWIGRQDNG